MNTDIVRTDLGKYSLELEKLEKNPFQQFKRWYEEINPDKNDKKNVMCLSTVGHDGRPSARMVLLRDFSERGIVFYTNFESRKAREIAANVYVALTMYWPDFERQVRVEGQIMRLMEQESDKYFESRPREFKIASWASRQSLVIRNRMELESQVEKYHHEFIGDQVPRPPYWGGFRVVPDAFEFWQGRENRLHDRFRFVLEDYQWTCNRLAP